MLRRVKTIIRRYPMSIFIIALILYLSFFNPPKTSFDEVNNIDKIAHFLMYSGFCCVLWLEYFLTHLHLKAVRIFWGAIIAPIVFSGAIELAQQFLTAHRGGDWYDFLFNSLGVTGAAVFSVYVTKPLMIRYGLWYKKGRRMENA
jgi:VanZ family protein